ncbi:hypothetical protein [Cellulomonas fengjieae]|uniref:hypothetical protein n=1 Tax=Cellulomonas fengjieae TaxID=2819978 RepID=UPI001AAEFA3E|nr:hypothetical protein [Cellulomonas fengjieae]MBO3103838.1 hypothetical protein [Cellulomonas fengjieae]
MATTVHCHVPITVRVLGEPDEAALAALREAVGRQVRDRLAQAARLLAEPAADADRASGAPRRPDDAAERYDEDRDVADGYAIPSYRGRGRRVPVPVATPPTGRGWRVLRSAHVRARVDEFTDWVETVMSQDPDPARGSVLPQRALYEDLSAEEHYVAVWVVEVEHPTTLGELLPRLDARALELLGGRRGRTMLSGATVAEGDVTLLATFDTDGEVARLPLLHRTNARRVSGNGASTRLLRRSRLVWAGMELPDILPEALLETGPPTTLRVPLAEASRTLDPAVFQSRHGFPWQRVLDEAGTRLVRVDVLPMRTRRAVGEVAIGFAGRMLLSRAGLPAPEPGVAVDDMVAYPDLPALPTAVRDAVTGWAAGLPVPAPVPRRRGAPAPGPQAPPGTVVLAVAVHLPLDPETLGAAVLRPEGRRLAGEIRDLMDRESRELVWRSELAGFFSRRLGGGYDARPPGGTAWEYALDELDAAGEIPRLVAVCERSTLGDTVINLLHHSRATRHRTHPSIVALFERLTRQWRDARANAYRAGDAAAAGTVDIDRDEDRRLTVGVPGRDVLGRVSSAFVSERDERELSPAAADRFRTALETERQALMTRLASGVDTREVSAETFLRDVVAAACERARITDDDFTTVTIETSLRLVAVDYTPVDDLPMWTVRLARVERREGTSAWTTVGAEFSRSADEFEAMIVYLRLGKAGELYATLGMVIAVVGFIAIAWEAGLIAALVSAGGGAKMVLASIAISELIYVVRVIFFDARLSVEGFLMAAVEGYLGALGFRAGALVAAPLGRAIGGQSVRRVWTGIVVEKLTVGIVGGSTSALLTRFARDMVEVAVRDGHLSGWRTYVRDMAIGAAMGVVAEFTVAPVMRALGSGGRYARTVVGDLVEQLRDEGYTLAQFAAGATDALSAMHRSVTLFATDIATSALTGQFRERVTQVLTAWAASATARRVLELSGAQFSRQAVRGLEIFLAAADDPASVEAARRLAETFADQPQVAVRLMEVLAALEPAQARHLMTGTFSTGGDLASFLSRIAHYTPEQQRGILALLAEANLVARPATAAGRTVAQVMDRQLEGALRLQAEAARRHAAALRREAEAILDRAITADQAGLRRRADALLGEAAHREAQAAEAGRLADELAGPPAPGAPPRVGDVPTDLPGDDPAGLADELDAALGALEAGTGTRQQGVWIQLPARQPGPEQARALSRLMFTSRTGNPVVFRIEGGSGGVARRSREYISIDQHGNTRIHAGGDKLNLNIGSFERAVEFILEARPGARLKMFEIDAGYLRNLRSTITPEQGLATRLVPVGPDGLPVPGATPTATPGRIADVQGAGRYVDTRQAADQIQLDGPIAAELNDFVIPRSGRVLDFTARGRAGVGTP